MTRLALAAALGLAAVLGLAAFSGAAPRLAAAQELAEAQMPVEPLEGLDPVLLIEGKEVQGDPKVVVVRDGFRYSFAGPDTRARFEREPERFAIQLHGLCARMGDTTRGNPDLFLVHEGHIYVFGSPQCRELFRANPGRFLEGPPARPLSETADAAARERGRQLVEAAVAALGGAAAVDGVESFERRGKATLGSGPDARELLSVWTYRFPGYARLEEQRPFGVLTWVVTPEEAFNQFGRGLYPLDDVQAASLKRRLARDLLALLKTRREPGFAAAAVGSGQAGDAAVERVAVTSDGLAATLGIDPRTGRVLSLAYRGRFEDGAVGEVVEEYSDFRSAGGDFRSAGGDFRATGGLTLPFRVRTTWNGQPWPERSLVIDAIAVNRELPADTFQRPSPQSAP